MTSRPTYPFEVKGRDVYRIAIPASIAFITEPLAGFSDITVIGRLGDAGMLGGLVLGALAFDFIFSMAYFLRLGTAGLTAQAVGARDPRDGIMHAARAILLGALIGVVMILLSGPLLALTIAGFAPTPAAADALGAYFSVRIWSAPFSLINYALLGWFYGRARATTGLLLQVIVHGVDVALSIYFVYGLGWGIFGAALGTVLGQVAAALVGLALMARHYGGPAKLFAALVPAELFDSAALRRMFGLSRDLMIRSVALVAAYAWFAAQGARSGEVVLSANAILLNFLMISGFFLDGLAQASEQLCGKAIGANWRPAFDRAFKLSMSIGWIVGIILTLLWYFGGPYIIDFMTTNEAVRAASRDFLWLAALTAFTGMPAFVLDGTLTGATLNNTMRNGMVLAFALFLASAWILHPLLDNAGLWLSLHVFFVARTAYFWIALERRKASLFAAPA